MLEFSATSPLAERTEQSPAVCATPKCRLSEHALSILSVRVVRRQTANEIESRIGVALPSSPNAALKFGEGWIVCTEPNTWRIISTPTAHRDVSAALASIPTDTALVTDLSSALCVMEISGADARRVIASGCPLDLHQQVFTVGGAASSRLVDFPVLILKISEEPGFLVICERFRALTVWDWLAQAAAQA